MIIGQKIPSSIFFWHPDDAEFSQEMSSLRGYRPNGRLFDDACDQGFVMVSDRTGEELPFYLTEVYKDGEGDLTHWEYKALTNDPKLIKLTVVVFND